MTIAEAVSLLQKLTGEYPTPVVFGGDPDFKRALTLACSNILTYTKSREVALDYYIDTDADQYILEHPTDYRELRRIEYQGVFLRASTSREIASQFWEWRTQEGTPRFFMNDQMEWTFSIWPIPDDAKIVDSGTTRVRESETGGIVSIPGTVRMAETGMIVGGLTGHVRAAETGMVVMTGDSTEESLVDVKVSLYYVTDCPDLDDQDELPLPVWIHYAAVWKAAALMLEYDTPLRDMALAQNYEMMAVPMVEALRHRAHGLSVENGSIKVAPAMSGATGRRSWTPGIGYKDTLITED